MKQITFILIIIVIVLSPTYGLVVHTSDFIQTGDRIHFNGFESRTGSLGFHSEGGITVEQINGQNDITNLNRNPNFEGVGAWYPNGGDTGFTRITLTNGEAFNNVGMLVGSGFGSPTNLYFELHNNGSLVVSQNFTSHSQGYTYLGFSDEVFDEIFIRDSSANITTLAGGSNALTLDSIEVSSTSSNNAPVVPEPSSLLLLASTFAGLVISRKK